MATLAELWDAEPATTSKSANLKGLNPDLAERLSQAQEAYRQQFGKELPITSGSRTRAEQEKLFAERSKNPNLVAQPGTSKHEFGNAIDIAAHVPDSFLNQYGLHRPLGKKDPVHVELMPQKSGATLADLWESTPASNENFIDGERKTKKELPKTATVAADLFNQFQTAKQNLGASTASLADTTLGSVIPGVVGTVAYPVARAIYGTQMPPEQAEQKATALQQSLVSSIDKPFGKALGVTELPAYKGEASRQIMDFIGQNFSKGADWISKYTGIPKGDVESYMNTLGIAVSPAVGKGISTTAKAVQKAYGELEISPAKQQLQDQFTAKTAPAGSVGAAAVPTEATIQQAISVASPQLQQEIASIPINKVNVPTLQRHIEADTLPVPVRLTEGQATGDVVKLSNEQNRRGRDPQLAQRFNEQNGQLVENLEEFRNRAAPDAPGSRTIDHSQGIMDAYKELDANLNQGINDKYQALRDAAGGQFPVDAPKLLENIKTKLQKELLSNEAPAGQFAELQRLAKDNNMTFEDYLSLRRNLGDIARTSTDGATRKAASYMIEELEKLPLQKEAASLKPLADQARKAARDRFVMLEKDPAFRAVVNDTVPADKFLETFVVKGHNKNVQAMVNHLGQDSVARQHMAAGTINFLRDRAGIVDGQGNFTQAGYNKALKILDDTNKMPLIFDGETATGLKTLGNVARYTQAQPRGAFVNNSNTLVGSLAEKAGAAIGKAAETGLNVAVPGLQLGTSVMEMRARRAAEKQTEKSLKTGAGIREEK
jgi:D-alanyl-D-alanine carboxypeptidase